MATRSSDAGGRTIGYALAAAAGFALAGCGGPAAPALLKVSGAITLDGKPVAGAAVLFQPDAGQTAYATTGGDGRFELTTRNPGDGAAAGRYRVVVSKSRSVTPVVVDEKGLEGSNLKQAENPVIVAELPAKYGTLRDTPLTATVEAGKPNEFAFPLASR